MSVLLAAANILESVADHPWPGCQIHVFGMPVTLMSKGIAAMILAAGILLAVILPLSRRRQTVPRGPAGVLEVIVYFVRDMIARPALHDRAEPFLPLLLTFFTFILTVNLLGLLPLEALLKLVPGLPPIGGVATSIPTVTGALAAIALGTIVFCGLKRQAGLFHHRYQAPMWLCVLISPLLWVASLRPAVPGLTGVILAVPLALLELVGVLAKCFALMIRLFANMLSGHVLLAVLMMFILQALQTQIVRVFYVGPFCIAGSVAVEILELLIAGLQAYIFTFLTAIFLALYAESSHGAEESKAGAESSG
ncbi:MAG: F0F1 ATP synthase subunit A [Phycisphaerae bacterium]